MVGAPPDRHDNKRKLQEGGRSKKSINSDGAARVEKTIIKLHVQSDASRLPNNSGGELFMMDYASKEFSPRFREEGRLTISLF